jgi:hypothetical protein
MGLSFLVKQRNIKALQIKNELTMDRSLLRNCGETVECLGCSLVR